MTNTTTAKLFVGCRLKSEINMYLAQSSAWKQNLIAPTKDQTLISTHYRGEKFIGFYLSAETAILADLKQSEVFVKRYLASFCPDFDTNNIEICVFPQVFIA